MACSRKVDLRVCNIYMWYIYHIHILCTYIIYIHRPYTRIKKNIYITYRIKTYMSKSIHISMSYYKKCSFYWTNRQMNGNCSTMLLNVKAYFSRHVKAACSHHTWHLCRVSWCTGIQAYHLNTEQMQNVNVLLNLYTVKHSRYIFVRLMSLQYIIYMLSATNTMAKSHFVLKSAGNSTDPDLGVTLSASDGGQCNSVPEAS